MAIPVGNILEATVRMEAYGQVMLNTWTYAAVIWPGTVTAEQCAEAFWNHVKASYRAISSSDFTGAFKEVRVRDVTNVSGDYGVYGIPLAEQPGTRTPPTGDPSVPFLAVGVRLNVGTRVTRPGQKRFPFLYDADVSTGVAGSGIVGLLDTLMTAMTTGVVLGAPAATVSLEPVIARRSGVTGAVVAFQPVTSYAINPIVTSQNTRKIGRGI